MPQQAAQVHLIGSESTDGTIWGRPEAAVQAIEKLIQDGQRITSIVPLNSNGYTDRLIVVTEPK